VLTVLVAVGLLRELDSVVFDLVQSVQANWLDVFASAVSVLGQAEVTAGIALGLAVARWRRRLDTTTLPLLLVVVTAVEVALKLTVAQPLPPSELSRSVELPPPSTCRSPARSPVATSRGSPSSLASLACLHGLRSWPCRS